jgi:hypothetical protein
LLCSSFAALLQHVPLDGSWTVPTIERMGYLGRYQLAPGIVMTMTRQENHFFTQLTGQPTFEIFALSERQFFLKVVDAQIAFEVDSQGRTTGAVLHQNGRDQRARRIE